MKKLIIFLFILFARCCNAQTITIPNPCKNYASTAQNNCPYGIITAATKIVIPAGHKIAIVSKVGHVDSAIVFTYQINGVKSSITIPKGSPVATKQSFGNTNFLPYIDTVFVAPHHDSINVQVTW